MKKLSLVFMIVVLLCYNASAFAELSVDDLDKIQKLLDKFEERIDKRFTSEIQAFDKCLSGDIQNLDKRLSGSIETLEKNFGERLTFHSSLIVALIASIIGFVAVPMGFITYQYIKMRSQQDEEVKVL